MNDSKALTGIALLRRRLAHTRLPEDPSMAVLPGQSARWPARFLRQAKNGLTPAGVLIPIIDRTAGPAVLLTQRSSELRLHAGQVSFPGGRMDRRDADIAATALRETHEEVGIPPDLVEVVGYLPPSPTVTGYSVTPTVGLVGAPVSVVVDPREVESAFEVPLDFLMDRSNQRHTTRDFDGVEVPIVEFDYAGRRIWGATATMLLQLRKIIFKQ